MKRYITYCTAKQTNRAIELGAPIKLFWKDIEENFSDDECCEIPARKDELGILCEYAVIPTIEQMIEWLEEQGFVIEIILSDEEEHPWTFAINKVKDMCVYDTRKEATLAAINNVLNC